MRTRISLTISLLLAVAGSLFAQNQWQDGIVNTKYGTFECKYDNYSRLDVNKPCTDKRIDLPWGVGDLDGYDWGWVGISMNSERHLYNAVTSAISREKLMNMLEANEKWILIFFDLTETGEIMRISYSLDKETLVTPDEVATMDSLIRANLRFTVVREKYDVEPHKQLQTFIIMPKEVLNGEIKCAKSNEMAKQYWK